MNEPLISVIVPCYNVSPYLNDFFESISNITYPNCEFIFVDDGSTDSTREQLKNFASVSKNIKVIHQSNQGVSIARNNGIKNSKGDYLLFLDPDDYFHPELISHLYKLIEANNCDVSICNFKRVKEKSHYKSTKIIKNARPFFYCGADKIMNQYLSIKPFFWAAWNKLYRHSVLKQIPNYPNLFNANCYDGEDALFNTVCLSHCEKAVYFNEKLYFWRRRKTSITHTNFNEKNLTLLENDKFLKILDKNKFASSQDYIKSKIALDNVILLFKFAVSEYKNPEAAKIIYKNFKENAKYMRKAKNNPWYCRLIILVLPIAHLMIRRKFK